MKKAKNLLCKITKEKKGYLTIELTMVFSILFFSLLLILFMGLVLYQRVNVQSTAIRASERGAIVYNSRVEEMETGEKKLSDFEIKRPYRNVPIIGSFEDNDYEELVNQYISSNLGQRNILQGQDTSGGAYATVKNSLISKKLRVEINMGYEMPVASIGEMFGQNGPFKADTVVESAIVDSPDFVRNVDLVLDMAKQTEVFDKVEDGIGEIMKTIKKLGDKLK